MSNLNESTPLSGRKSLVDIMQDKADALSPAVMLAIIALIAFLTCADSYYSTYNLFAAPVKNNSLYVQPSSNDPTGLYTWKSTTETQYESLYMRNGVVVYLFLFLAILGTSLAAAFACRENLYSLVLGIFVSGLLGYIYHIFSKATVDLASTSSYLFLVIFLVSLVGVLGYSLYKGWALVKEPQFAKRKTWVLVAGALGGISAVVSLVFHGMMMSSLSNVAA